MWLVWLVRLIASLGRLPTAALAPLVLRDGVSVGRAGIIAVRVAQAIKQGRVPLILGFYIMEI